LRESAEFRLAVECCRDSFDGWTGEPATPSHNRFDWQSFLDLVSFHRVEGFVWNALSNRDFSIPRDIRAQLSVAASTIAADNLKATVECATLRDGLAEVGVPLLFLKGLTLASLAYGRPALKAAVDIDVLIDLVDLEAAADLLREHGYRVTIPRSEQALRTWHRRSRESVWVREQPFSQIDLHTRVADNPLLIPGISVRSSSQIVDVGSGQRLPTLATEELFAYLAVHGGTSSWFRLKWVSDFAGLIHSKKPAEIEKLYRRSQEQGAGRAAAQGLLLADRLFETLAKNPELRAELQRDRATRRLVEISFSLLARRPREPTEHMLGTLPLHLAPFLLMPGWRYKASELVGQVGKMTSQFVA